MSPQLTQIMLQIKFAQDKNNIFIAIKDHVKFLNEDIVKEFLESEHFLWFLEYVASDVGVTAKFFDEAKSDVIKLFIENIVKTLTADDVLIASVKDLNQKINICCYLLIFKHDNIIPYKRQLSVALNDFLEKNSQANDQSNLIIDEIDRIVAELQNCNFENNLEAVYLKNLRHIIKICGFITPSIYGVCDSVINFSQEDVMLNLLHYVPDFFVNYFNESSVRIDALTLNATIEVQQDLCKNFVGYISHNAAVTDLNKIKTILSLANSLRHLVMHKNFVTNRKIDLKNVVFILLGLQTELENLEVPDLFTYIENIITDLISIIKTSNFHTKLSNNNPLHYITESNSVNFVETLLRHGAILTDKNTDGISALSSLCYRTSGKFFDVIKKSLPANYANFLEADLYEVLCFTKKLNDSFNDFFNEIAPSYLRLLFADLEYSNLILKKEKISMWSLPNIDPSLASATRIIMFNTITDNEFRSSAAILEAIRTYVPAPEPLIIKRNESEEKTDVPVMVSGKKLIDQDQIFYLCLGSVLHKPDVLLYLANSPAALAEIDMVLAKVPNVRTGMDAILVALANTPEGMQSVFYLAEQNNNVNFILFITKLFEKYSSNQLQPLVTKIINSVIVMLKKPNEANNLDALIIYLKNHKKSNFLQQILCGIDPQLKAAKPPQRRLLFSSCWGGSVSQVSRPSSIARNMYS